MPIPHFFSVERQGYTKVSDLFADVMKDMIDNGFVLKNSSNDYPLKSWKANINASGTWYVGNTFYVTSGVRPINPLGIRRPAPTITVTSVINESTGLKVGTSGAKGTVASLTDVMAKYDFPIWTDVPTGNVRLWKSADTSDSNNGTNVYVTFSEKTISRDSLGVISDAPMFYSFVLEAGPLIDPLNGTVDPNSSVGAPLSEADRQPWRIRFDITDEQKVNGSVATKLQMDYDAELGRVKISQITDDDGDVVDNVGSMGGVQPGGVFSDEDLNQGFYNRKKRVSDSPQTFPLNYQLTITNRGFFLGVWEGSWSTIRAANTTRSNYFNWVLVQRPVDRVTGATLTKGKAPVFHVNSVNYKYYKQIVREVDILHPTSGPSSIPGAGNLVVMGYKSSKPSDWKVNIAPDSRGDTIDFMDQTTWEDGVTIYDSTGLPISKLKAWFGNGAMFNSGNANLSSRPITTVDIKNQPITYNTLLPGDWSYTAPNILAYRVLADQHSPDNHMIFNGTEQIALTEDKTYLLSFPHNLTTPRFRYTEELDMIGATSSDVVMAGQDIQFTTYAEWGPRTYRALPANSALNTGFRIAALTAPMGPKWVTNAGKLRNVSPGESVNILLEALKIPDEDRGPITFELIRGQLPTGIQLIFDDPGYRLAGTVEEMDYDEATDVKFTISARNAAADGDGGYALRDFWFRYVPV